ncbi:MAG: DUF45 domain-containing protein [Candidatus Moranbacteria bacterium]|nr:DUF45 domain-containing protein [Candidatus Moranbacteria bacterium]
MLYKVVSDNFSFVCRFRRHPRARSYTLSIRPDGAVLLTMPQRGSVRFAQKFVREKHAWIFRQLVHSSRESQTEGLFRKYSATDYIRFRNRARAVLFRDVSLVNRLYQFSVGDISVRNQRSRWGSCSQNGDLSFNFRTYFLPEQLRQYIVAHELCHIAQPNHSSDFWDLVARFVPEHRLIRRQLRSFE